MKAQRLYHPERMCHEGNLPALQRRVLPLWLILFLEELPMKKIFALLLAACAAFTLFAGCGQEPQPQRTDSVIIAMGPSSEPESVMRSAGSHCSMPPTAW